MSTARRHHYVSEFYLENFVDPKTAGHINVLDITSGHRFRSSPENVCAKRDFNRVNSDDLPIDALENALSGFEDETSDVLKRVVARATYPSDEELNWLLNLVALYATRNLRFRSIQQEARDKTIRLMGSALASDERLFESELKKARDAGYVESSQVDFQEFRDLIRSNNYQIEIPQDKFHDTEFKAMDKVLPLLGERIWSLLILAGEPWSAISCDHPIITVHKNQFSKIVGLGTRNTELIFPLSPRVVLYGVYEDPIKEVVEISDSKLAWLNTCTYSNARKHVFSSSPEFLMRHNNETIQCSIAA